MDSGGHDNNMGEQKPSNQQLMMLSSSFSTPSASSSSSTNHLISPASLNHQQQQLLLPPTKIKRQYKCTSCDHATINPRQHLRHRIDVHGHKLRIVECPLCVYACQYRQKLNRHLRLVHHCLPNQVQARLNLVSQHDADFSFAGLDTGTTNGNNLNNKRNQHQANQLAVNQQVDYQYNQLEFFQQTQQQLYNYELSDQHFDPLKCPMLHSIHAYASQLVRFEVSDDDEPMDLSFPSEIKQIMRSFDRQLRQQPQFYLPISN